MFYTVYNFYCIASYKKKEKHDTIITMQDLLVTKHNNLECNQSKLLFTTVNLTHLLYNN